MELPTQQNLTKGTLVLNKLTRQMWRITTYVLSSVFEVQDPHNPAIKAHLRRTEMMVLDENQDIVYNHLVSVYRIDRTSQGRWIGRSYFQLLLNGVLMINYAGYNFTYVFSTEKGDVTGELKCVGTYRVNVNYKYSKKVGDRVERHCKFLIKHFDNGYLNVIYNYQVMQPLFLLRPELKFGSLEMLS